MSSQNLSITQTGAVARITLTQPEIRNAFSDEVIAEITAAFVDVGSRADVRAVVLAAEGPAFCAGANLNWMRRMADYTRDENIADAGKLADMLRVIYRMPQAHDCPRAGRCVRRRHGPGGRVRHGRGGGYRRFLPERGEAGAHPRHHQPLRDPRHGRACCAPLLLTAERFGAAEALRIGFVHEVVAADELDAKVDELLKALTTASPNAVRVCKKLVIDVAEREINAGLIAATVQGIADIRASDEGKEGVQSFLNKRKPSWLLG